MKIKDKKGKGNKLNEKNLKDENEKFSLLQRWQVEASTT